jgi:hypothetical protein
VKNPSFFSRVAEKMKKIGKKMKTKKKKKTSKKTRISWKKIFYWGVGTSFFLGICIAIFAFFLFQRVSFLFFPVEDILPQKNFVALWKGEDPKKEILHFAGIEEVNFLPERSGIALYDVSVEGISSVFFLSGTPDEIDRFRTEFESQKSFFCHEKSGFLFCTKEKALSFFYQTFGK